MFKSSCCSANSNDIHAEEAGHKAHWEEEYGDYGEDENRFAVVVLESFDELYVLDGE